MEYEKTIKFKASNPSEAIVIAQAFRTLAENLTYENIKLIAEKSKVNGINEKLQKVKNFI